MLGLRACLSSAKVVTLPLWVHKLPAFSLDSSINFGYMIPSKDISKNWFGPMALYITNGPT